MTMQGTEAVVNQLSRVLASDRFPDEAKLLGARLLDRLRSPVQVVVLGKPGSGKSRLINMLLGQPIYTQIAELPTCEIVYGEQERMFLIRADETIEQWHQPPDVAIPSDVIMARLELPIPALNTFNLIELTLAGSAQDQRNAANWATERADIALWCTQSFDAIEQALWAPAPDPLKDHSFMVITKADQLLMKGLLQDRISGLEEIVAQEFHSLYSIATIQAISALHTAGAPDPEVWSASGGHALHAAVLRLVETGRRADTDNALLFLSRYSATAAQADQWRAANDPADGRASSAGDERVAVASDAAEALGAAQRDREVFAEALEYLQDRAEKMLATAEGMDPAKPDLVLEDCLDTANRLSELLQDFDDSGPALAELQQDVLESADMMLLLQLEQTEDAAADAVTLLLQLKKEVAEKTAG